MILLDFTTHKIYIIHSFLNELTNYKYILEEERTHQNEISKIPFYDIRRNPKRVYADIRFPELGNVVYIWYYIGGLCTGLMCRLSPISVTLQETTFLWTWVAGGGAAKYWGDSQTLFGVFQSLVTVRCTVIIF